MQKGDTAGSQHVQPISIQSIQVVSRDDHLIQIKEQRNRMLVFVYVKPFMKNMITKIAQMLVVNFY